MKFEQNKDAIKRILETSYYVRFGLLFAITILFTITLYPNLVSHEHVYSLGDVAEKDIKTPVELFIEDKDATETSKTDAVNNILTVYDYNSSLTGKITDGVNQAFKDIRYLLDPPKLSEDPKTENVVENIEEKDNLSPKVFETRVMGKKDDFESKIGIPVSDGAFKLLLEHKFSENISGLINRILSDVMNNGVVANKEILLKEQDKGITLRDINTATEKTVTGLKSYYGLDQAKTMVRIIGQPLLNDVNYTVKNLIVDFVQRLIQPNITLNTNETEKRKSAAEGDIKPMLYKIKAGEMLLREGERVTQNQLIKLEALKNAHSQSKENVLKSSIGGSLIILSVLMIIYVLYINLDKHSPIRFNKNLLFMSLSLVSFFLITKLFDAFMTSLLQTTTFSIPADAFLFGIPIAAGAMIVCIFMGLNLSIAFSLVITVCISTLFQNRLDVFLYHFLNSTMAAYWVQDVRERKVFIKAGGKLGLLNILLSTVICIYTAEISGYKLLWVYAFAFFGGVGSGIIASGMAPLVEITFGYTTDITLLELANLDRPILRRLMMEAPGTYHHSVIVGSMVEAAAREIGVNPLLAKVCGYYHDIGKINKPLYFIENQSNGQNKHNKLAPSMSSLILMSHVKEGVEIAAKHKLGPQIIDIIRQHHGNSLISFFYEKAKAQRGKDAVKINDFRYPGPIPQTIEAGLVMLADVVEASARTLDDPTPARIQGHVQTQINKIFSDGQLDNCELTLKDLHSIAKVFIKILNGIYHNRIDYPEKVSAINGKAQHGNPDRQQTKQIQHTAEEIAAESTSRLKRLGLS